MEYSLKFCPHCGGAPFIEPRQWVTIKGVSVRCAIVRCTECGARTGKYPVRDNNRQAIEDAVTMWNARYETPSKVKAKDPLR
jgi:hypothetical protein